MFRREFFKIVAGFGAALGFGVVAAQTKKPEIDFFEVEALREIDGFDIFVNPPFLLGFDGKVDIAAMDRMIEAQRGMITVMASNARQDAPYVGGPVTYDGDAPNVWTPEHMAYRRNRDPSPRDQPFG